MATVKQIKYRVVKGINIVTDRKADPGGKRFEIGEIVTDEALFGEAKTLLRKKAIVPMKRQMAIQAAEVDDE